MKKVSIKAMVIAAHILVIIILIINGSDSSNDVENGDKPNNNTEVTATNSGNSGNSSNNSSANSSSSSLDVTAPVPPVYVHYTVVRGDNLSSIAKKHNTTVAKIQALNNNLNPNKIYVGQKLVISKK